ncbi:hypothetical protein B0H19DRAFT_1263243 [Mycena capillaripes]|nr:hypothetical protein B0H19DRAFT_1263243 [Mycena capillaripes]
MPVLDFAKVWRLLKSANRSGAPKNLSARPRLDTRPSSPCQSLATLALPQPKNYLLAYGLILHTKDLPVAPFQLAPPRKPAAQLARPRFACPTQNAVHRPPKIANRSSINNLPARLRVDSRSNARYARSLPRIQSPVSSAARLPARRDAS